ncbi:hypothetical protein ACP70R_014022 [Stipagrostis hirtigluma subsp. patula]
MVPGAAAAAAEGVHRAGAGAAATSEEERRRKRMTSNRLSARKSRMKQRQHVEDLTALADRLRLENEAMRAGVEGAQRRSRLLEQENRVLAAHARELCAALLLRNSQLRMLGDVAGVPLDVPGVPDHLLQLYGGGGMQTPRPLMPMEIQMLLQPDVTDATSMLGF